MRHFMLPATSPTLRAEAFATLLQRPLLMNNLSLPERSLWDISALPEFQEPVVGMHWSRWQVLSRKESQAVSSVRRGHFYGITQDRDFTLRDDLLEAIGRLTRPVLVINTDDWRANRVAIRSQIDEMLEELQYPDREATAEKLYLASNWSKAGVYQQNEYVSPLIKFWGRRVGGDSNLNGWRYRRAIREVRV